MEFANWVPVIHINNTEKLALDYNLSIEAENFKPLGEGQVYEIKRVNQTFAAIGLLILLVAIFVVVMFDRKDRHFTSNIVDHDLEL